MEDIHQIINVNQIKEVVAAKTWLINESQKEKKKKFNNTIEQLFAAV